MSEKIIVHALFHVVNLSAKFSQFHFLTLFKLMLQFFDVRVCVQACKCVCVCVCVGVSNQVKHHEYF